jgi:hypothetical protein
MIKKTTLKMLGVAALAGLVSISASAQNTVDIGIFQNEGNIEVKVRPQTGFDGIFSSVVFTIRWDKNSGATLEEINAPDGVAMIPMMKSGGIHENGIHNYQIFSGVGFQTLEQMGTEWKANEEYTILSIPYRGSAEFELVNDAWTNIQENNGNFYVSMGGRDETGVIYKNTTGVATSLEGSVSIQPNPNNGLFNFSFVVPSAMDLDVEVVNTLGQVMYSEQLADYEGRFVKEMDLTNESNGVYYLKLKSSDNSSVHKIVFR